MLRSAVAALVAMLAATAALHGAARAFPVLPCWAMVPLAALLAWPMWHLAAEQALFERRALLTALTHEDSRARRWLWRGRLARVVQAVTALFWAALLAGIAARLAPWQWAVLAADATLLALVAGPVGRRVASEVRFEHADLVARRWPLAAMNLAVLAVAFFALQFWWIGAPDTRGLTWLEVFDGAWTEGAAAACPLAGALLGTLAAGERLAWHAAEVLVPGLPSRSWRYAAWAALLLQAGLLAWAFTRLMLGAAALATRAPRRWREAGDFAAAFWITALLAAAALAWALQALPGDGAALLRENARTVASQANPCRPDAASLDRVAAQLDAELEAARLATRARAAGEIDRRVADLFAEAELGIDRYLDWYFTVLGEYQRLGSLAAGDLDALMARQLETHLFGGGQFGERLERASVAVARESEQRIGETARALATRVRSEVRTQPCALGALDMTPLADVRRDVARASAAAGAGLVVGALTLRAAARALVASAAARGASKSANVGRAVAGRAAGKRAGGVLLSGTAAAALCAPGGPVAFLCGLIASVVTWLGMDVALVHVDEALFRDGMRKELVETLREQQRELSAQLRTQHEAQVDAMARAAGASLDRAFIPARDGL